MGSLDNLVTYIEEDLEQRFASDQLTSLEAPLREEIESEARRQLSALRRSVSWADTPIHEPESPTHALVYLSSVLTNLVLPLAEQTRRYETTFDSKAYDASIEYLGQLNDLEVTSGLMAIKYLNRVFFKEPMLDTHVASGFDMFETSVRTLGFDLERSKDR